MIASQPSRVNIVKGAVNKISGLHRMVSVYILNPDLNLTGFRINRRTRIEASRFRGERV